ncbi:C-type lectin 1, partial [Nibea albiflora]
KIKYCFVFHLTGFFYFTFASYRLRLFTPLSSGNKKWTASLDECKKANASFVTLYDDEDAMFVIKFTESVEGSCWLGLHKNASIATNSWSNGKPLIFSHSSVNVANGTQKCEAIDRNTWRGFDCSERKYFMCYKGNNYSLVQKEKNWCQALQYCRKHYTDLVSISSQKQNGEVIKKGNDTTFWIGLLHDNWEWVDRGCSSFRQFDKWEPHHIYTGRISEYPHLKTIQRLHQAQYFCSKGTVRIKVIDIPLTWEEAFDYCRANHTGLLWIRDANDEQALRQWLNGSPVDGPFWIGLRQSRVFGFWFWTSESDSAVTVSNWKNGEPELPFSNHCAVIDKTDMKWSDENCLVPHRFLCEEEILFMNRR